MDEHINKAMLTKYGIPESVIKSFIPASMQDWQRPLLFDWEGKYGPPFTEDDLNDCEISRIIRDEFDEPWADPNDQKTWKNTDLDPGRTEQKRYPRLSSLTKQQHLLGLKVLSAHYGDQPSPSPTPEDFQAFEEIKELYEEEQKEYREWAKNCWIDKDCIRTLDRNNAVETVYEALLELKKNKIRTLLYNNFSRAGYISLESRTNDFEFHPIQDLKSVDVQVLPNIGYPDKFKQSYRDMHTYRVPKPCPQHPCQFILPYENKVTSLSLSDVHLELAHFAVENDTEFIASENALQCLLDIERGWKLPMLVAEVVCPDGGGVKTVVVVGSQFSLHKECAAQRTNDSFRHLLKNIFTTNTEDSREAEEEEEDEDELQINVNEHRRRSPEIHKVSWDESNSNAPSESDISNCCSERDGFVVDEDRSCNSDQFYAREPNQSNNSNKKELQINVNEQRRRSPEIHKVSWDESNSNALSESDILSCCSERDGFVIDEDRSCNSDQFHARKHNQSNNSNKEELQINVNEHRRRSPEIHKVSWDESNSNAPSESDISNCCSERDGFVIDEDRSCNSDQFYAREPNQSNNSNKKELQINVNEQRRRSPEIHKVSWDESNSNAPSESDILSCCSERDGLVIDEDRSCNSDQFYAREPNQSNNSNKEELQINVNEQRRRSPEIHKVSWDESNSNAPSESDILICCSERDGLVIDEDSSCNNDQFYAREPNQSNNSNKEELQININEQRRRSPEIHKVSWDESNSNAPSESDILSCCSERDGLVKDEDRSCNSDQFYAREPNQSNNSNKEELQINADKQRRRSPVIHKVSWDESNSNAPSESDISSCCSERDGLLIDEDRSCKSDQFYARETNQSNNSNKEELQININEQRRRSPEIHKVSWDESNSNAPSESDILSCCSERDGLVKDEDRSCNSDQFYAREPHQSNNSNKEELQINADEQRRRSPVIHKVSWDESNSNAPSESDISSCCSERDGLLIDEDRSCKSDQFYARETNQSNKSNEDELDMKINRRSSRRLVTDEEVSVPDKREYYQTEAKLSQKQNFSVFFGSDSDEEPALEEMFQAEAETEVAVHHEEQTQNIFVREYTDKEKAQTCNQIFDTAKLPAYNVNSNFKHNDGIRCTCAMSEKPSPRSFKKWQIKSAASGRSLNIIIHASHKTREGEREVILEPIVELQPELGACEQSAGRLRALALALMMRPKAELMNVRMRYDNGNIIMVDKLDEEQFMIRHGDKRSEIADTIHKVIVQLLFLKPGHYILVHNTDKSMQAMVYAPQEETGGAAGTSGYTLTLRPKQDEKDDLTDAVEAKLSKIPPTLSRAMLPYHKVQGILPLAFTPNKRCVIGYKKKKSKKKVAPLQSDGTPAKPKREQGILPLAVTPNKRRDRGNKKKKSKKKVEPLQSDGPAKPRRGKHNRKRLR